MTINWIEMIDARSASALASGALQPVQVEQTKIEEGGLHFSVRWCHRWRLRMRILSWQ